MVGGAGLGIRNVNEKSHRSICGRCDGIPEETPASLIGEAEARQLKRNYLITTLFTLTNKEN